MSAKGMASNCPATADMPGQVSSLAYRAWLEDVPVEDHIGACSQHDDEQVRTVEGLHRPADGSGDGRLFHVQTLRVTTAGSCGMMGSAPRPPPGRRT